MFFRKHMFKFEYINSDSRNYLILSSTVVLILAIVILFRYPDLVLFPRFWAEETVYFETFFHADGWLDGFDKMVYPSYYSGLSRLAGLLATLVELEFAPVVTTAIGFLTLMTPIVMIFYTDCNYWNTLQDKIILSLFLIFSCSTGEIWLNSCNLQFITPVISFLILLDDNLSSRTKRLIYSILIGVCSITGPITLFMSPFFILRYLYTKNRQYAVYSGILFIFGLLHLTYYLISYDLDMMVPNRLGANTGSTEQIAHLVSNNIIFPIFGYFLSISFRTIFGIIESGLESTPYLEYFSNYLPEALMGAIKSIFVILHDASTGVYTILFILLLMFIYYLFKWSNVDGRLFFIIPFIYLSITTSLLSIMGVGGFRYSYITGFILLFSLYNQISIAKTEYAKKFLKYTLVLSIAIGVLEYYPRMISYTSENWPIWNEEVRLWEKDNKYSPLIWPSVKKSNGVFPERKDIWYVDLNKSQHWNKYGNYKFSKEVKKYFVGKIQ